MKTRNFNWIIYSVLGLLALFATFFIYRFISIENEIQNKFVQKSYETYSDTLKNDQYTIKINKKTEFEVQQENLIYEIKFSSLHSRISDMYYTLAIIITLLIIGFVTVSWRTRAEVNNYMDDHFDQYKQRIIENHSESSRLLGEIRVQKDLLNSMFTNLNIQSKNNDANTNTHEEPDGQS